MVIMFRQGDVLFVKVKEIPKSGKRRLRTDIVVRGEATGHAHRIVDGTLWGAWNERGFLRTYVKASKETKVVHEEHKEIIHDVSVWLPLRLTGRCYMINPHK